MPLQSAPQSLLDGLPLDCAGIHGWLEKLKLVPTVLLRLIHGGVGILNERVCVLAVIGVDADADARRDMQLALIHGLRLGHHM